MSIPTTALLWSITGSPLMWFSSINRAASAIVVSGLTQITGAFIMSAAFIEYLSYIEKVGPLAQ